MPVSARQVSAKCVHLFYVTSLKAVEADAFEAAAKLWHRYRPRDPQVAVEAELQTAIDHFLVKLPTGRFLWRWSADRLD